MNIARDLTDRLTELLHREHLAMADFLVALADFDRKRHWEALGYRSLFSFLRRELRLSAGAAQYRKTAAELVQRYPDVEAALRDGRLCLSSVIELSKVISPGNAAEILPRFFGLSSRDAAFVAASIRPVENPPVRDFLVTPVRGAPAVIPTAALDLPQAAAASSDAALVRAPELNAPGRVAPAALPPAASRLRFGQPRRSSRSTANALGFPGAGLPGATGVGGSCGRGRSPASAETERPARGIRTPAGGAAGRRRRGYLAPRLARRLRFTDSLRLRAAVVRFAFERFDSFRFERFPRLAGM
jgi:hypothetical protein